MRKIILWCVLMILLLISLASAELSACSSGGLTTSVHHRSQMAYTDEDFMVILDVDYLCMMWDLTKSFERFINDIYGK